MTDLIRGNKLKREGKLEEAIAAYQRAIDSNPIFAWSHYNLGEVLSTLGRFDEAVSAYRRAIELNPNLAWAHHNLGLALEKQGKLDEAHTFLQKASELNPDFTKFSENVANIIAKKCRREALSLMRKHKMGKINEAIACLEKAIKISSAPLLYNYNLGCLYKLKGEPEKANYTWEKVASRNNKEGPKVAALLQLGKLREAKNCFKQNYYDYEKAIEKKFQPLINLNNYPDKTKPDCLIIGVPKCGTSSLYRYLTNHPFIAPATHKELNLFISPSKEKTIDWYLNQFPNKNKESNLLTGEASPGYFPAPLAHQHIFNLFSNIKLIVILRNPIERAVSRYYMHINGCGESRSLEEAMKAEMTLIEELTETELIEGTYWGMLTYILEGLYLYHFKKWMSVFPREQFLILKSEDLFSHPEATMKLCFEFLGLPDSRLPEYRNFNPNSYPTIDGSIRQTLADYFRPYNQKLEEYLGMKFNWE